jgi:hypothetical protein
MARAPDGLSEARAKSYFGTATKEFELTYEGLAAHQLDAVVINGIRFVPEQKHETKVLAKLVSDEVVRQIGLHTRPGGALYHMVSAR